MHATQTGYKEISKKFIIVTNTKDVWDFDLVDLQSVSQENDKFKYRLNAKMLQSRHTWCLCIARLIQLLNLYLTE